MGAIVRKFVVLTLLVYCAAYWKKHGDKKWLYITLCAIVISFIGIAIEIFFL